MNKKNRDLERRSGKKSDEKEAQLTIENRLMALAPLTLEPNNETRSRKCRVSKML